MVGANTPLVNVDTMEDDELKRGLQQACGFFGQAFRSLKPLADKLGVKVQIPQTPIGGSTSFRAPTPIGKPPAHILRRTPGAENRPIFPVGLAGAATVQGGKGWIGTATPPRLPGTSPLSNGWEALAG